MVYASICRAATPVRGGPRADSTGRDESGADSRARDDSRPAVNSVRDDNALYGDYVASKLRNIRSRHARNTVQYLINQILYNADLGQYDHVDGRRVKIVVNPQCLPETHHKSHRHQRDPEDCSDEDAASASDSGCGNVKIIKLEAKSIK
ncbi:hypothetical protein ACJJTC_019873 [Scirpophaga incertulas]